MRLTATFSLILRESSMVLGMGDHDHTTDCFEYFLLGVFHLKQDSVQREPPNSCLHSCSLLREARDETQQRCSESADRSALDYFSRKSLIKAAKSKALRPKLGVARGPRLAVTLPWMLPELSSSSPSHGRVHVSLASGL